MVLVLTLLGTGLPAKAAVDPDCFAGELSFTCALNRVDDAKEIDRLIAPIAEAEGWHWSCYKVQFVRGDEGGPDTILVVVAGAGVGPNVPCANPRSFGARTSEQHLRALGERITKRLSALPAEGRKRLLANTETLHLADGWGTEVELSISRPPAVRPRTAPGEKTP